MPDHRPTIEQLSDADIDKTIKGTHRITRKPIEPAHAPRETGPTSHPWKWEYSSEYRGYCLIGSRRQMICCFQDDSTIPPHEDQSLIAASPDLLEAARQVLWKLSHNFSASGNGDDCRPGTVDRNDATVEMLARAIAKATASKES